MRTLHLLHTRLPGGTRPVGESAAVLDGYSCAGVISGHSDGLSSPSESSKQRSHATIETDHPLGGCAYTRPGLSPGWYTSPYSLAGDSSTTTKHMGRLDLPDPPRDEDDPVVEFTEHHCIVLTHDWWCCEDCGASFARDATLGDYPEECIIESGNPCVVYTKEESNE